MPNPILPSYEYIPDGEPRVFNNRVYLYGSHDRANSNTFCDYKLRVWSADVNDLDHWRFDGDSFHTRDDDEHKSDIDWSQNELYAPDVVEKDGMYYLYFYVVGAKGGVAVSDRPEGPFKLLSKYKVPDGSPNDFCNYGSFIDPGAFVDDDGKVYVYCGYLRSYMVEINPDNMYEVIEGSYQDDIIPVEEPYCFFEAASMRKVNDTYYLIYSPKHGSRLVYATSKSPKGPFEYGGVIIDNGVEYPGGNDHGSICEINGQWYIFYHRMTNNTIFSRRACVERIQILEDGTIPQVEMTSLGFSKSLCPYEKHSADLACVLIGGNYITESGWYSHPVVNNKNGSIIGFKYFDFDDDGETKMDFTIWIKAYRKGKVKIIADSYAGGDVLGEVEFDGAEETASYKELIATLKSITGVHAIYFIVESEDEENAVCDIESFAFKKG